MADQKTLPPLTENDFKTLWDNEKTYPFVESEDATIMGYGHPDKEQFAAIVTDYDMGNDPKWAEPTRASEVEHVWAIQTPHPSGYTDDGWWIKWSGVTSETPNAFPVSIVKR